MRRREYIPASIRMICQACGMHKNYCECEERKNKLTFCDSCKQWKIGSLEGLTFMGMPLHVCHECAEERGMRE